MYSHPDILVQSLHCDIWAKDAFGPSSWGLPFGPEPVLKDFSWTWHSGEVWAILGSSTSGKDALAYALVGQAVVRPRQGEGSWVNRFRENGGKGIVFSFEEAEKALRYSFRFDESDFVDGGQHPGLTVERFLEIEKDRSIATRTQHGIRDLSLLWDELGLESLRNRGLKYLSTGELRKVLLFKALIEYPSLLICVDLWEGLDIQARQEVTHFFQRMITDQEVLPEPAYTSRESSKGNILKLDSFPAVLFLCDREDQILPSVTHVLRLKDGRVEQIDPLKKNRTVQAIPEFSYSTIGSVPVKRPLNEPCLIHMKNVRVVYEDRVVFDGFDFELYAGEHCFIQGPNGCGKSTLVKLITGDHPQGWVNEIEVAGIKRTLGERMQDIRMQTSLVSHELHRSFLSLEDISILEVVLSGFFATVGVYEPVGEERIAEAQEALRLCGLSGYENRMFRELPWGIQRLVLAARAFVRRPPLMILDEPCTGLDEEHREILLRTLERIAEESQPLGRPTILLVSHDPKERLSCIKAHLLFYQDGYTRNGQPQYRWKMYRG
ncbi:MAG: ATP-binding cassette domain-containing protein [Spirochaetes bacterium]|nr:ATP-binding cassette domain-containing protein [Spirochaetota bacterium]